MTEAIICSVISAIVTLIGVFMSARSTQDKMSNELKIQQAVTDAKMKFLSDEIGEMKKDIKEHNHYAQLFVELKTEINHLKEEVKETK